MIEWFLLVVRTVPIGDPLAGVIGQPIPMRRNVEVYGPLATETAARQAGADLKTGEQGTTVILFTGERL